jgi:uncharacterized repeat protein (TIGR03803 family)
LNQATNGLLYGLTEKGGANGDGVLFCYDPSADTYTDLLDFQGTANGANPYGSVVQASNGLLYGMTYNGGANNQGIIFSYNPSTNSNPKYTKLLDFNGANGEYPYGSLIQVGDTTNAIVGVDLDEAISIYPNPTNELLTLQSALFNTGVVIAVIHDITGKTMNIAYRRGADKFIFNTSSLAAGLYFVQVSTQTGAVSKKFVKVD